MRYAQEVRRVEEGLRHLRKRLTHTRSIYHYWVLGTWRGAARCTTWWQVPRALRQTLLLVADYWVKTPYIIGSIYAYSSTTQSQGITMILPRWFDSQGIISGLLRSQGARNDGGKVAASDGLKNIIARLLIQANNTTDWLAYNDL